MMTTQTIEILGYSTLIKTIYWWQESLSVDPKFFLQFFGMGGGLITYLDQMPNIMAFESKSTNFRVEKDNKNQTTPPSLRAMPKRKCFSCPDSSIHYLPFVTEAVSDHHIKTLRQRATHL